MNVPKVLRAVQIAADCVQKYGTSRPVSTEWLKTQKARFSLSVN